MQLGAYVTLEALCRNKNSRYRTLEASGKSEVLKLKQRELQGKSTIAGMTIKKKKSSMQNIIYVI